MMIEEARQNQLNDRRTRLQPLHFSRRLGVALRGFLDADRGLFSHGFDDGDEDVSAFILVSPNPISNVTLGNRDVVLLLVVRRDEVQKVVFDMRELVLSTGHVGHVHVVGGRAQLFKLLAGEDIDSDQMDLGVTVLAGLGSAHLNNLAGTALDDDMPVLAQSRALHRVSRGGASTDGLEGVVLLLIIVSHFQRGVW